MLVADADASADRILVGPEPARQFGPDDGDACGTIGHFARREIATRDEADAQRIEQPGSRRDLVDHERLTND